jgi:5-methylcytosine-specific restriction endonuclease McrA
MKKLSRTDVLVYRAGRRSQKTIRKFYTEWREEQNPPLPVRCDIPECFFFTNPLVWNGKEIKLILDHINGVCGDNRTKNLRLLCPNCNSQQLTHGGGNKGKIEQTAGGFSVKCEDGKKNYVLPTEAGKFIISFGDVKLSMNKK